MRAFRWLLFLTCFTADIHVRAENQLSPVLGRKVIAREKLRLVIDEGGLLAQTNPHAYQLVRGQLYVEMEEGEQVRTPFASFWCDDECTAIFSRDSNSITVKALAGAWRLRRTGDPQIYGVGAGTSLKVSAVDNEGRARMDWPQSLPWLPTIKTWARLFPGQSEDFRKRVTAFRQEWKESVEAMSVIDHTAATRAIASWNKAQDQERARRLAQEREDAELRRLFREKNNLSP